MKYDTLYQEWLDAKRLNNFAEADRIRTEFERLHGLTIFAEGEMPTEEVTVRRMKASAWHKKYGDPNVGKEIERQDSFIRYYYPTYKGLAT